MASNGQIPSKEAIGEFIKNRQKFPQEELDKYAGLHIAYSLDGRRIVASGATLEEVEAKLVEAGIDPSQVVGSFVDLW